MSSKANTAAFTTPPFFGTPFRFADGTFITKRTKLEMGLLSSGFIDKNAFFVYNL